MTELELTPSQDLAIRCIDRNVAVSAGAGSGKTRVLVQRFLYILSRGMQEPACTVSPGEILTLTFTRKAAAEMRDRIRKELEAELSAGIDSEYWQWQLKGLSRAQIGTIHSFCSNLLRSNPAESKLDPAFVVMEENDNNEFLVKEVRSRLRRLLHEGDSAAVCLCEEYGSRSLQEQTVMLLNKGIAFAESAITKIYEDILSEIGREAELLQSEVTVELAESCSAGNSKALKENLEKIKEALAGLSKQENAAFLREVSGMLTKRGKNGEAIGRIKERLELAASYPLITRAAELASVWARYLVQIQAYIKAQKMERGILSFDDLEEMALELLETHPEVLQKCRRQFRYIMVDEFQDTNERQRQLIYLLCGGDRNRLKDRRLFVVGDPKQSIYRFRGADVSVFAKVRNEIGETGGEVIRLRDNFRTVNAILGLCNDLFPCIMGTDRAKDVFYEPLQFHRHSELLPQFCVFRYGKNISTQQARKKEANYLAAYLNERHRDGVAYKDMAVLLQYMTHIDTVTEALRNASVPYTVADGRGFYDRIEIQDLMNLFSFAVNPHDDLTLTGILRSVYIGLHDAALTRIHIGLSGYRQETGKAVSLWDFLLHKTVALEDDMQRLLQRAVSVLQQLLMAGTVLNLPDFCKEICRLFHPETVLSIQENGEEQLADLRKFFRMANDFAVQKQGAVYEFALRLAQLKDEGVREAAADVASDDAVKIMTVHKSKGLEFSLVAVPFLEVRARSDTDRAAYHPGSGLGISLRDAEGVMVASEALKRIKTFQKEKDQEEKLRLLYVAITRAKDMLFLSGCQKETKGDKSGADHWLNRILNGLPENYAGISRTDCNVDSSGDTDPSKLSAVTSVDIPPFLRSSFIQNIEPLASFNESSMTYFSASSLQEYDFCPRRYYYRVLEKIPPAEKQDKYGKTLPPDVLGTLVHKVLEQYAKWRMEHDFREDESIWQALFRGSVEEFAGGRADLAGEAEAMLREYIHSSLYHEFSSRQKYAEYSFQLPLLQDAERSYTIAGVIDVIAGREDGTLEIIDYKSGKTPDTDADIYKGYTWQMALYRMAAEKLFQRRVAKASLHFLRNRSEWILPEADYRQEIVRLCSLIAAKKGENDFAVNEARCRFCPFLYMCKK